MIPRPPRSTRTDTLFPYTTLFLSPGSGQHVAEPRLDAERYERLLPYAVALDVEEAWTGKFTLAVGAAAAAASAAAISWYRGGAITDMGSFASSVGSSLSSQIASSRSEERRVGKGCVSTCRYR